MILDPPNDRECLGQLSRMARELARTSAAYQLAARLGSPRRVEEWLRSLPQSDDDGRETLQAIACDVAQRVRLFPNDPNCFERTLAALALCEVLDPKTARCAVTIARPVRHTSAAELDGDRWRPLDLFPRRNFSGLQRNNRKAEEVGKDVVQAVHTYIGKPLLTAYGMGGLADAIGEVENKAMGRPSYLTQPQPSFGAPPPQAYSPAPPYAQTQGPLAGAPMGQAFGQPFAPTYPQPYAPVYAPPPYPPPYPAYPYPYPSQPPYPLPPPVTRAVVARPPVSQPRPTPQGANPYETPSNNPSARPAPPYYVWPPASS